MYNLANKIRKQWPDQNIADVEQSRYRFNCVINVIIQKIHKYKQLIVFFIYNY